MVLSSSNNFCSASVVSVSVISSVGASVVSSSVTASVVISAVVSTVDSSFYGNKCQYEVMEFRESAETKSA